MSKIKKGILISIITLVVAAVVIIACISPIAKYLVEKYSVKYLGRVIKVEWIYLNPFTGYIRISHLRAYEANSDSLFLTADGVSAKYEIFKMLHKTYEISSISLNNPVGYIIQDRDTLNFSDLILRFRHKGIRDTSIHNPPVHFNILNISVTNGEFHYIAKSIPINYFVKNVNIESSGKWWNVDSMIIKFALQSGPGTGVIKGNGSIEFDSAKYNLSATITKFDLKLINQYLQALSNYGHISALLDGSIKGNGSFKNGLDFTGSGYIAVSDFHFGAKKGDDFASFDKMVISASEINPKNFRYYLDSVMLSHPYFKYERYDYLNNVERMFGKGGARIKQANADSREGKFNLIIEIGKYVQKLASNFMQSYYQIGRVAIYNGDVRFNDFSLRDEFSVGASSLNIITDSIDRNNTRFEATLNTNVKPYGNIYADLKMDPADASNFDLKYRLAQVPVSIFNPYVVSYTSFPLDRGILNFNGFMNVEDSMIKSDNHLLIVDPHLTFRVKKKDTKWLPVPLIMSLVRSTGNAIDFEIPIAGNLASPKFKFRKVILDVVSNIFIKPPSTAYLVHAKQVNEEVEKSLSLTWQTGQAELRPAQEKFVNQMAVFLNAHPDALISVESIRYADKEKEYILLFEAKKKYYLQKHHSGTASLSEEDSMAIDKMSSKDSFFVRYLDYLTTDSMLFTVQQKCHTIISQELVDQKFAELLRKREMVFTSYFGTASNQIKFSGTENTIPFNGFSYYKIDYKGEIPAHLIRAYREMQQLNDAAPRKKYLKERKEEAAAGR